MFSSKEKCCLTCANWIGARKTLFQGKEAGCNSAIARATPENAETELV